MESFLISKITHEVGCIYTGDSDLHVSKISEIYSRYWNYVGTIQIPHHGSIYSYNEEEIKSNVNCPISVGLNSWGHPSYDVLTSLYKKESMPIIVGQEESSVYVEIIDNME